MAWKPWYEQVAEMNSAQERVEFLKGVFGPARTTSGVGQAATTFAFFLAGAAVGSKLAGRKK